MDTPKTVAAKHRFAKREAIIVIAVGALATLVAAVALHSGPPWANLFTVMLALLGPITILLGFVGFYTYLENIEEERYMPPADREAGLGARWS